LPALILAPQRCRGLVPCVFSWTLVALAGLAACGGDGDGTSPDGEAPIVTLTAPASGTVQGTITLTADAHDNRVISAVQFYLSDSQLGTDDLASPYTIEWNTTSVANGQYSLLAKARDEAGNTASSVAVTLTVSNQPPAPTTGSLDVSTSTIGPDPDDNGYGVMVDGILRGTIPSNGTASLPDVAAGSRTVSLIGVAGNCSVEGFHPRQIPVIAGSSAEVAFSITCTPLPEPERIAFGSPGGIYTMTSTGSDVRLLASGDTPAWSPDRTRLAYIGDAGGFRNIFVMNANGTGQTRLTPIDGATNENPAWSPDGTKIVFESNFQGNDIYVMNADGTDIVNLTSSPGIRENWPTWSPDGTRIAFTSSESGNDDIWVMNADGADRVQLTTDLAADYGPAWSPDGTRIAFTSQRTGDDVWIMNADGTQETRLTDHPATDRDPTWSPDGTRIAFSSFRDGLEDIFVINVDGTGLVNLTNTPNHPDQERLPAWAP
jgi:Big-like domain-containing protein/WD40 repeat protein